MALMTHSTKSVNISSNIGGNIGHASSKQQEFTQVITTHQNVDYEVETKGHKSLWKSRKLLRYFDNSLNWGDAYFLKADLKVDTIASILSHPIFLIFYIISFS